MEQSIMNNINELTVDSQMDLIPTLEEGISVVPRIVQVSKSECVPRVERILKKLDSIANLFLKILLPKSLNSTPPPDRQIFY